MSKTLLREEQDVPRRKARQKERRALHQVLSQIDLNTDQTQIDEMISQRVEKNPSKTVGDSFGLGVQGGYNLGLDDNE